MSSERSLKKEVHEPFASRDGVQIVGIISVSFAMLISFTLIYTKW